MSSDSKLPKVKILAFSGALLTALLTISLGIKLVDNGLYIFIFRDIPYRLCIILGRILTLNFGSIASYPFCDFYIFNFINFFKPLINGVFRIGTFALAFALFFGTFDLIRKAVKEKDIDLYQKKIISFYGKNRRNKIICYALIFCLAFGTTFLGYQRSKILSFGDGGAYYKFFEHTITCKKIDDDSYKCSGRGNYSREINQVKIRDSFRQSDTCDSFIDRNTYSSTICKAAARKGLIDNNLK